MVPVQQFLEERRHEKMSEEFLLEGPVLLVNGEYVLLIPLNDGGAELVECSRGIGEVQGEFLKIVLPQWLVGVLRVEAGDIIRVGSEEGKFRIRPTAPRFVN
jgi:hypothetical protein